MKKILILSLLFIPAIVSADCVSSFMANCVSRGMGGSPSCTQSVAEAQCFQPIQSPSYQPIYILPIYSPIYTTPAQIKEKMCERELPYYVFKDQDGKYFSDPSCINPTNSPAIANKSCVELNGEGSIFDYQANKCTESTAQKIKNLSTETKSIVQNQASVIEPIKVVSQKTTIQTEINKVKAEYQQNPHWFREKLIDKLNKQFNTDSAGLVYKLLPDIKL